MVSPAMSFEGQIGQGTFRPTCVVLVPGSDSDNKVQFNKGCLSVVILWVNQLESMSFQTITVPEKTKYKMNKKGD